MTFSFTDTPFKRTATLHTLTFLFNICNLALFFESSNEFAQHYGLSTHRLTNWAKDNDAEKTALIFALAFTIILFFGNQHSYSEHISEILPTPPKTEDPLDEHSKIVPKKAEEDSGNCVEKYLLPAESFTSSLYKTIVSTTSLAALLKNGVGEAGAWIIAGLCIPGNFSAQLGILGKAFVKQYHWTISDNLKRLAVAHLLTLSYNLPNAALYFNAGDEFLHYINVTDHRLIDGSQPWEYFLLGLLVVSSIFLLISTQRAYAKKVTNIFKDSSEEPKDDIRLSQDNDCDKCLNKSSLFFLIEAVYSTAYKAFINYISLVSTLYSFHASLIVSFLVPIICIVGNLYAQYSILKPELSRQQKREQFLEPKESESRCFGLFPKTVVSDPIGVDIQGSMDFSL